MEIHFYGYGKEDTMFVEPNSIIEDVLKEFLKRNNYYLSISPELYTFRYGARILNSPKFIDRRINDVGEHICPYGCGRLIPDKYKGCTELLQAKPNYFS